MKRTEQEYDWMEGCKNSYNHKKPALSPFFLRKPYTGTSAEPKDDKQQELHEVRGEI
jgi:hypothetical protein